MSHFKKFFLALIALAVSAFLVGIGVYWTRTPFPGRINALGVDLARPDAYVWTPALSSLPRDLVKAPVARDLLTEDFVFYYEEHEDRLNLRGAIKRIAYEHATTLSDKLLEMLLDEPAELALWADAKGAPRHWLIAMTRGPLAQALQGLATIAAQDTQLKVIAELRFNGSAATVYALTLSPRRTLAFVSQGERIVVLSDPGLLFDNERRPDSTAYDVVAQLLAGDAADDSVYRRAFGLQAPDGGHTMVADVRMLSFGYQHFFPGLAALRFDIARGGATVHTLLRVNGDSVLPAAPADRALWQALPMQPAACAMLPADWARVKAVGSKAATSAPELGSDWATLADAFDGPAAVCWYARSRLHTPVLVAQTKEGSSISAAAWDKLSAWMLRADPAQPPQTRQTPRNGAERWQREVHAPWGLHDDGETPAYKPTLARQGRWVTFSPDDTLVDLALDAQARRYPSAADSLPAEAATLAVIAPPHLADLAEREAFDVLPPQQEVLYQAAKTHLVPRLAALRRLPAVRAVAAGAPDAQGWVDVQWQPLPAKP